MKKNNPYTPIMLREAMGTEPRVFARYGRLHVDAAWGKRDTKTTWLT